ncbi:hypothetical protein [Neobacillus mesonae]|uniref:hypothetical protein n=1 Tax=Neobacillus mesonae TaxID=1193713 RepID=UPI00203B80F7|nr:hypothetical protein [Neobacillus mesonae]MCM3569667.1 hypothetical protein [Neobacillus mesonae]
MDKKQKISWGVSFGSLALAAGMVSYLGLSNGNSNNKQMTSNPGISSNNNSAGQSQGSYDSDQEQRYNHSFGEDSPFNQDEQDGDDQSFGSSNQQDNFGGFSSGHHHGFDTTTGGT